MYRHVKAIQSQVPERSSSFRSIMYQLLTNALAEEMATATAIATVVGIARRYPRKSNMGREMVQLEPGMHDYPPAHCVERLSFALGDRYTMGGRSIRCPVLLPLADQVLDESSVDVTRTWPQHENLHIQANSDIQVLPGSQRQVWVRTWSRAQARAQARPAKCLITEAPRSCCSPRK
jgi:hypothetical protein